MKRRTFLAVTGLVVVGVWACASIQQTGATATPADLSTRPSPTQSWTGGDTLSLVTWNLGYAGLGRGSDFFADGGRSYLPPSRRVVRENADAIAHWLSNSQADVILNQEVASSSAVNWWVDLKRRIEGALPGYGQAFYADFRTRLLPPPLRIRNGLSTFARAGMGPSELWPLPNDGDPYDGALRRHYAAIATRLDGPGGCWTIVNTHLSAFDDDAALRRTQIRALLDRAQEEAALGRRVVIGGDWNLRLGPTDFPHTTEERFLFWVHDFPRELLPPGWRIAGDVATPSVRTNERPFIRGENYTTTIDGFIVGPGVTVESVQGQDLDFLWSDHNPVRLVVRPEGPPRSACQV